MATLTSCPGISFPKVGNYDLCTASADITYANNVDNRLESFNHGNVQPRNYLVLQYVVMLRVFYCIVLVCDVILYSVSM